MGRGGAGGFTLIDVIVTIAVLLVLLPVVVEGFKLAGDMARLTRQRAEATSVAQSKLDEILATGEWQLGDSSGIEQIRTIEYEWSATLTSWEEAEVQPLPTTLQRLDVTVQWTFRAGEVKQQVQLSTVVYLPDTTTQTTGTTGTTSGVIR
jgi:type II secretory pathway pseudopilin PulG